MLKLKEKGIFAAVLIISIVLSLFPSGYILSGADIYYLTPQELNVSYRLNHEVLRQGQKGVDYSRVSFIDIQFDPAFKIASANDLDKIKVLVNGSQDVSDEFSMDSAEGIIRLSPVGGADLRKHVLYSVHVPAGILVSNTQSNEDIYLYFTTGTDEGDYHEDILQAVSPEDGAAAVNTNGQIAFTFIDDIGIDQDVLANISGYIQLSSQPMYPQMPGYNVPPSYQQDDSIDNYNVSIEGNRLLITPKNGVIKDFAHYTVKLKNNTVYLQRPYVETNGAVRIYNQDENYKDYTTVKFSTGNMLAATSPENNETGVSIEPVLKFFFKYPVEFNSDIDEDDIASYININCDNEDVYLDDDAVSISTDGKTLQISLDDVHGSSGTPLKRNSLYQVTVKAALLRFVSYPIFNETIKLQFVTRGEGESPVAIGFYSDVSGSDDIRYLDYRDADSPAGKISNLNSDGSIYIKFDRTIRHDPQGDSDYMTLLEATHLYRMPAGEYSSTGRRTVGYDLYKAADHGYPDLKDRIIPSSIAAQDVAGDYDILEDVDYMEEMPVANVSIVSPDMLKITPQSLQSLNKYKVLVDKTVIEDENGYNPERNVEFTFWTTAAGNNTAGSWLAPGTDDDVSAQEVSGASVKTYQIDAAPLYSSIQPLVLNIKGEVIPVAEDELLAETGGQDLRRITYDSLLNTSLVDVYNTDNSSRTVDISTYKFEYRTDTDNGPYTRIYLYPARTLESGKSYRLTVPKGVLESRSRVKMEALQINFTTQGDEEEGSQVYQLADNTVKATDIWQKGEWIFKILGHNFFANIEKVILTPVSGQAYGPPAVDPVEIPRADIELRTVTELRVKIRGDNAARLATEAYCGNYKITVVYTDGTRVDLGAGNIAEMNLTLCGSNFRSDISRVTLQQSSGNTSIILVNNDDRQEIEYVNSQKLILKITGANAQTLAASGSSGEYTAIIDYESHLSWTGIGSQWSLDVYGKDFGDNITGAVLTPLSGNAASLPADEQKLAIAPADIKKLSSSHLQLLISGDSLDTLKDPDHAGKYQVQVQSKDASDYISAMDLFISASYGIQIKERVQAELTDPLSVDEQVYIPSKFYFTVLSKGRPKVTEYYPPSSGRYDETKLLHDVQNGVTAGRYFLKITFEDIDNTLELNSLNSLKKATVTVRGSSASVLDSSFLAVVESNGDSYIDKYLLVKDRARGLAYLYIPVLNLQSQMTYVVNIPAEVVKNDSKDKYNEALGWAFSTMSVPAVKEKDVLFTVSEKYDASVPLIIIGDQFYGSALSVYFGDTRAARVDGPQVDSSGQQYLAVYLPEDPRLEPGLYDIKISNDNNHKTVLYGTLSVVAAGKNVPQDGQRVKSNEDEGQVIETVLRSEDTLVLKDKYTDKKKLEIDLDKIMGTEVLTRKIQFEGDDKDRIDKLITLSQWADITLYKVSIDDEDEERAEIRLGRTPPALTRSLSTRLRGQAICSNFIEVGGENLRVDKVDVCMPFNGAVTDNLKVLRYDEKLRKWNQTVFEINWVDQKVTVAGSQLGIFVVVQ